MMTTLPENAQWRFVGSHDYRGYLSGFVILGIIAAAARKSAATITIAIAILSGIGTINLSTRTVPMQRTRVGIKSICLNLYLSITEFITLSALVSSPDILQF